MQEVSCQQLSEFMKTQLEVVRKHLDEYKYLRRIKDSNEALASFIKDYGWLIREMHCSKICSIRDGCEIATEMSSSGDLLSKRVK